MGYAKRHTLLDAVSWARGLTNVTGKRHSVYRLDPRFSKPWRQPWWIIQLEAEIPPKRGDLEATIAVHSEN